nr:chymotrypsin-elastase inhibitor ixodidin-like isoform X1 [Rhipicephalus microplus]
MHTSVKKKKCHQCLIKSSAFGARKEIILPEKMLLSTNIRAVLVAAAVLAVLHASYAQGRKCGEGEVYKENQSSSCGEHKCGDPENGPRPCTLDLVSRCFCKDGFYRRSDDKCVSKGECH